jgi:hypothetical protein
VNVRTAPARVAALAGLAVAVAVIAGLWSRSDAPTSDGPAHAAYFNVDGRTPSSFPASKLGLAFLSLDEPIDRAVDALGPPTSTQAGIFGIARTWRLPDGARLTVSSREGPGTIYGLFAFVPPDSPVRLGAFGHVVVGRSSLREVVAAWGGGFASSASPSDDYVVSYVECVGPSPIVVKFDQVAAAGPPRWDEPVTSILVAYADEPAGSAGCSP